MSPVEQDGMESAMECQAGADAVPRLRQIDLDEQPAAVVADTLPRDHDSSLRERLLEAERSQRTEALLGPQSSSGRL